MPATIGWITKEAAQLFYKNMVIYWWWPRDIITIQDHNFNGKFWRELFCILGTKLHFSTSFHPQTDVQSKRVNTLLEFYLRHFVSARQKDWVKILDMVQFYYNL